MLSLNSTLPGEVPPPPDDEGSRCHLLGTTGIIVQFISKSSLPTWEVDGMKEVRRLFYE
jgi:hypothetical protein